LVEYPKIGAKVKKQGEAVTLESVKATASVYSPVDGVVKAVNNKVQDNSY
jgi:glycine cleavage system H lipoate-binding protein